MDTPSFDLSFLDDVSKEIKDHLYLFCSTYHVLSEEQQQAIKQWLEALVAVGDRMPHAIPLWPRIVLDAKGFHGEGNEGDTLFHWRLPPDLLLKAIKTIEQKGRFEIDAFDPSHWF